MLHKKDRRIYRHRLPNLSQPGMKFDSLKKDIPLFFDRINNTFKLLQQPYKSIEKSQYNYQTHLGFYRPRPSKKKIGFSRTEQLAKPRKRSMSMPQQLQEAKNYHKNKRYSFSQMSNKISKPTKQPQIIGSILASIPLDKILAERDQISKVKQFTTHLESEDQQQQYNLNKNDSNNIEDLIPVRNDLKKWITKIIGGKGKSYEQYEKKLMERVKDYQRKENDLHYKSMWR